jgi:ubiquinone/menaquinone biosynthesis C-methylase UbiE
MERILEPEIMDGAEEAEAYESMDFSASDQAFVDRALKLCLHPCVIADLGCGNGKIPSAIAPGLTAPSILYAIDRSLPMLALARQRLRQQCNAICISADVKQLPFPDQSLDIIVSNSLVHHLPDARILFREIRRVIGPGGAILIRDLFRPATPEARELLVARYASGGSQLQIELFRNSLQAALTPAEVSAQLEECGLSGFSIHCPTDRHWSVERSAVRVG